MGTDAAKSSSDPPLQQDVDATALVDLSNSSYIPSPLSSVEETVGVALYPNVAQRLQNGRESMLELLGQTTNGYLLQHYNEGGSSGMSGPLQSLVQSFGTIAGETRLLPSVNEEFDPSSRAECSRRCIAQSDVEGSPERIMVDESGYDSSESSVYEVASDVENYGKDFAIFGDDEVTTENQIAQESPVAEGQMDTNGNGHDSADEDEQVPDCPCLSGNPYMHVMSKVAYCDTDDTAQTWKRRTTNPKGESRPHSRVARCMGPIEIALRNAPNRKTKYIFEPMLGITFDSEDEAYNFYNMYSWERGFGIKKDTLVTNTEGTRTKRDLRCLCSGSADQAKFKSKKTRCPAMIRLLRTEDDGWYISRYVTEHNHAFTETCGQTNEWKSHGGLDASAMEMIKYLRENNVSLAKVHCIMGSMYGSMENIPITKRSMRAICHRIAKDQMDNDVQKTLDTFRQVRREDPGFQCSVEVDEKDRISDCEDDACCYASIKGKVFPLCMWNHGRLGGGIFDSARCTWRLQQLWILTMFYARNFDGQYLTRILTPEARTLQKCNMLFQLLTMFGNMAQPPASILEAITSEHGNY